MGVTELERGKVYWKVIKPASKTGKKATINKIIVLSNTKLSDKTCMLMIDIIIFSNHRTPYVSSLFLGDYNIPENTYNQNRIFANQSEAEAYAIS